MPSDPNKPTWVSLLDYAIHTAHGRVYHPPGIRDEQEPLLTLLLSFSYAQGQGLDAEVPQDKFHYDMTKERNKTLFKSAVSKRLGQGYIKKDGNSYLFTREGEEYYNENYELSSDNGHDDDDEEGKPKKNKTSKKTTAAAGSKKRKSK
ncbi:hypothetical protein JCM8547_006045 [Rhodosporidiobolus lusitaniae]